MFGGNTGHTVYRATKYLSHSC